MNTNVRIEIKVFTKYSLGVKEGARIMRKTMIIFITLLIMLFSISISHANAILSIKDLAGSYYGTYTLLEIQATAAYESEGVAQGVKHYEQPVFTDKIGVVQDDPNFGNISINEDANTLNFSPALWFRTNAGVDYFSDIPYKSSNIVTKRIEKAFSGYQEIIMEFSSDVEGYIHIEGHFISYSPDADQHVFVYREYSFEYVSRSIYHRNIERKKT